MTEIYLASTDRPTAYLNRGGAAADSLKCYDVDLDGEPAPSRLTYAVDADGDSILTADSDEILIFAEGRGPITISSVELVP